jgi:hypothetical protein
MKPRLRTFLAIDAIAVVRWGLFSCADASGRWHLRSRFRRQGARFDPVNGFDVPLARVAPRRDARAAGMRNIAQYLL